MTKCKNREIIDNRINGNLATFRQQIKRLSKKGLLCLLCDVETMGLTDVKEAIYRVYEV